MIMQPWLLEISSLGFKVEQCVHLNNIAEDPVKMWLKIKAVHLQKHPGTCFNAYDNLLAICMKPEEMLSSLMNRVDQAIIWIQNLCLEAFTLAKMDQELACMAMICTLPEDLFILHVNHPITYRP